MADSSQLWDRLEAEKTEKAWQAFVAYRDMALPRSLAKLGQSLGCTKQNLETWSSKNNWVDRCRAYDAHRDRIKQDEAADEMRELARRNVTIARSVQSKIAQRLSTLKPSDLTPAKIPAWLRAISEMEKTARGAPAYRLEVSGPEGGAIEHNVKLAEAEQQLGAILGAILAGGSEGSLVPESDE